MNIPNIAALATQLKTIGFEDMGSCLVKRICFQPQCFVLTEKLIKGADRLVFHFYFEKDKTRSLYQLVYYDAQLQKEDSFPQKDINGISIREVEESMALIDWKAAFDFSRKKPFIPEDKASYEMESSIEQVVTALSVLESKEDGKPLALSLKHKYWSELPYPAIMGNFGSGREKTETAQRFYCQEGQRAITAEEAYRFLQNRWLEKQMQAKKRQQDSPNGEQANEAPVSGGSGLLKKRRLSAPNNKKKHNQGLN